MNHYQILDVFWKSHDPTTLNRQGNDIGTQYRSAIYYTGDKQKRSAEQAIKKAEQIFDDPITTELKELDEFDDIPSFGNDTNEGYLDYLKRLDEEIEQSLNVNHRKSDYNESDNDSDN